MARNRIDEIQTGQRFVLPGLFILITLSFLITGCMTLTDPEASQLSRSDVVCLVDSQNTCGQTFVSRRPRLNSLTLWLAPQSKSGKIVLDLFHSPDEAKPLLTRVLPVASMNPKDGFRIPLPPLGEKPATRFYLRMHSDDAQVFVYGRSNPQYPHGTLIENGKQSPADLAFRTTYDYDIHALMQDFSSGLGEWGMSIPALLVILLPGWLLLRAFRLTHRFSAGETLAISLGLSLALLPLLMQWLSFFGFVLNRHIVLGGFALLAIAFIVSLFRPSKPGPGNRKSPLLTRPHINPEIIWLLVIILFALVIRLIMTRDLATPAWVDSIHHALITRLILANGKLPPTFLPYLPAEAASYHTGFHSTFSFFVWLSGLNLAKALLFFGQLLNAAVVLATFLFTKRLFRNSSAALLAALVTAVLTPMPAYYASWGRYTQLAGLLILPVPFAMLDKLPELYNAHTEKEKRAAFILTSIALAGLFLTHYRVLAFTLVFLFFFLLFRLRQTIELNMTKPLIAAGLLAMIFVLPSLVPLWADLLIPKVSAWGKGTQTLFAGFSWRFLTAGWGTYALGLALAGILLALFRFRKAAAMTLLWVTGIFLAANLKAIGIPVPEFINNLSVEIMLFLPVSAFAGFALGYFGSLVKKILPARIRSLFRPTAITLLAILSILAAQNLIPILNPVTFITRKADLKAITWIRQNIPENERIFINPGGWGYGLYMGTDGGYWIAPLAGNPTLPPPVIYGLGSSDYVRDINQNLAYAIENADNPENIRRFLIRNDIRYVYLGSKGGILRPGTFENSAGFETLYKQDGCYLFQLARKPKSTP